MVRQPQLWLGAGAAMALLLSGCTRNEPGEGATAAAATAVSGHAPDPFAIAERELAEARRTGRSTSAADLPPVPGSCQSSMGLPMAQRIADQCTMVSEEEFPPCNVHVTCRSMIAEIAKNCVYGAGGNALPQGCTPSTEALRATNAAADFYVALNAKDFATAYHLWGQGGAASGKSLAEFQHGFADTRSTQLNVMSVSDVEGAAGSLYATVNVTLAATMNDGHTQRFRGDYIMRRVNDVPGASAEQLRWHIDSARLRPIR